MMRLAISLPPRGRSLRRASACAMLSLSSCWGFAGVISHNTRWASNLLAASTGEVVSHDPSTSLAVIRLDEKDGGDDLVGRGVGFETGGDGVVVAQRPPLLFAYTPTRVGGVASIKEAVRSGIPSGAVVDAWGEGEGREVFSCIPKVSEITLINAPLLTGVPAIDALVPMGMGQNMLYMGEKEDERTLPLLRRMLITQLSKGTKCVYCLCRSNQDATMQMLNPLLELYPNDLKVVRASGDFPAECVLAGATAAAIAEQFSLEEDRHALLLVDDFDAHKMLWDDTTRTLLDVFGEAGLANRGGGSDSESRAFYSSLLQRSANFKHHKSFTLLVLASLPSQTPSAEDTTLLSPSDFNSPTLKARVQILADKNVPLTRSNLQKCGIALPFFDQAQATLNHLDDLVSMSDGQIWLSPSDHALIDVTKSLSRVGIGKDTNSRADAPLYQKLGGARLRFDLAQMEENANREEERKFVGDQRGKERRDAIWLGLHPFLESDHALGDSALGIMAARRGFLDGKTVQDFELLIRSVQNNDGGRLILQKINNTMDLEKEDEETLEVLIQEFFRT